MEHKIIQKPTLARPSTNQAAKKARLGAALKENLKRRKQAAGGKEKPCPSS